MRRRLPFVLITLFLIASAAHAQSARSSGSRHAAAWIAIGAGGGFGAGLWAGLRGFDQSINSDRKVWTTATVSATAGGVLAYFLTRNKDGRRRVAPVGYSLRSPWSGDNREARDAGR
jgi:hypothetical protein